MLLGIPVFDCHCFVLAVVGDATGLPQLTHGLFAPATSAPEAMMSYLDSEWRQLPRRPAVGEAEGMKMDRSGREQPVSDLGLLVDPEVAAVAVVAADAPPHSSTSQDLKRYLPAGYSAQAWQTEHYSGDTRIVVPEPCCSAQNWKAAVGQVRE